ncbi:hypothetical protein BDV39DRAFT_205197 [Aspergillus sergii]|uniref:Uncharacterized protein n=1 Tax=Aspergillus sergii TaxID=1034303 RepID=A0A5N6X415_9EURO|nr:hypothetical protein BDV39DRAFT_205197 [Aspergillus sergii]
MAAAKTTVKFRADSELMKNQKHAVVMGHQQDFQVLQTVEGDAIFFSIGTDLVLYVTREVQKSSSGWNRTDLSSALGNGKAKSFAVSQNPQTFEVDLALVMAEDGVIRSICPATIPSPVMDDLYMLMTTDDGEVNPLTWFVDIVSNPNDSFQRLGRYYIEPDSPVKWNAHDFPNDIEKGNVSSCLGRRKDDIVDGIYTLGKIGSSQSLIFTPIYNPYDRDSPPNSARLNYPTGSSAMSSSIGKNGMSNLFVAGDSGLYLFPPGHQKDRAEPTLIIPSSPARNTNTFAGATSLRSSTVGSKTAVWGLNQQKELVYATCPSGDELSSTSWSSPLRICTGVSEYAFYLNRKAPANVLFARVGDEKLVQLSQDLQTGMWSSHNITLPATEVKDIVESNTFTTHIKCSDPDGMPVIGESVRLESKQGEPLTINNTYYKISANASIEVQTDETGSITIIQETDSLSAVCFTLICGDQGLIIDPCSKIVEKLSAIKSGCDLSNVQIPNSDGNTKPLVPPDISAASRDSIAKVLPQLLDARSPLPKNGSRAKIEMVNTAETLDEAGLCGVVEVEGELRFCEGKEALEHLEGGISAEGYSAADNWISTAAADFLRFLKTAWNETKSFFVRTVKDFKQLVVEIGGKIYTAILDSVNAVVGAIEFIFKKIKVFFEDLVAWLGFIFNWGDILRTHRVFKNIFKQYAQNIVDKIDNLGVLLESGFDEMQGFIDGKSWEGLEDSGKSIGDTQREAEKEVTGTDSPQSNWAAYHTTNGFPTIAAGASVSGVPVGVNISAIEELIDTLKATVKAEEEHLKRAVQDIKEKVVDQINSLSPIQVVQRILGILSTFLVHTAKNIVLLIVDVIKHFISTLLDYLDTPLEIPVISPIYKKITYGDSLSCIDVVCLIGAIPTTLIYKSTTNKAPFPDNPATNSLIKASSFSEISELLSQPNQSSVHRNTSGCATTTEVLSPAKTVVGVSKMFMFAVAGVKVALGWAKRESGLSGKPVAALSLGLVLAAGSPTIASNFVSINKWTLLADCLLWTSFGNAFLENSGLLHESLTNFITPWATSLLGLIGLVTSTCGYVEKEKLKESDLLGLLSSWYSNIGSMLVPFASLKMFPEIAPVVFLLTLTLAQMGGIASTASGKLLLDE